MSFLTDFSVCTFDVLHCAQRSNTVPFMLRPSVFWDLTALKLSKDKPLLKEARNQSTWKDLIFIKAKQSPWIEHRI
jgi:hypothetical protein